MSVVLFLINVIATIFLLSSLLMAYSIQTVCNRDAESQAMSGQTRAGKLKNLLSHILPRHSDPDQQKALRKLALVMWGCFLVSVALYFLALVNMNISLV